MTKMVYSFDVFDTCLCRLCGEPRLLFDVLSLKVQEMMGDDGNEQMRQLFVVLRAESGGKSLNEIYDHVAKNFPLPCSVEQMAAMEMELEKQMLVPIVATRNLVNGLREKGDIRFISDMYLPSAFIRERLVEHGFFKEGDKIYVSDELQAWKHDGSLYRFVHETEGIAYRRWHHYGNCRHSDYKVPRGLSIHAHHLSYGYLSYEEQWRRMPVLQYQYPAILAGVARAVRLSTEAPEDQKAFVCDISAPLMVSWVLHMMCDAQHNGVRRLFFCARDTHSQFMVARRLQLLFPDIKAHYLFISRDALHVGNEEDVARYFMDAGVLSNEKTAIVDSNSCGETLRVLNRMAESQGCRPVVGYFIVSSALPKETALSFPLVYPRYISNQSNKTGRSLIGMKIFFELILSLNYHRKTIGYERRGDRMRPVFGNDDDDRWCVEGIGTRSAKKYNDRLSLKLCEAVVDTGLYRYNDQLFDHVVLSSLADFFTYPKKTYLHYLRRFVWWDRPFVGPVVGKSRGLWRRGNLFYCLPGFFSKLLWKILK